MRYTQRPIEILLVEDDLADELITREVFDDSTIDTTVHVVRDGRGALDFLFRRGPYGGVPRPDLVLLDLRLPGIDGREVLARIRADPALSSIAVIVLTASDAEADILRSYQLAANAYITKPVEFDQFTATLRKLEDFFLHVVRLPEQP